MKKIKQTIIWFFVIFTLIAGTSMAGALESVIPGSEPESVDITFVFSSSVEEESVTFNANPSKTIYSLEIEKMTGKNMDLPLRNGPVEGIWTRMLENDRFMVNVALLVPAKEEPELVVEENQITLKFWRSSKRVSIDSFKAYGMDIKSVISYLFGTNLLNLPYVVTPSISNIRVNVGFSSTYPEDILRNVLISLGKKVGYAYLTDGTFYMGTPEEVTDVVNAFWKTYIGVDIKTGDGITGELDKIRNRLPIEAFLEYLPNMSTLLAFGDLETHMMLSELLTSSYITKEYTVSENISDAVSYGNLVTFGKQIAGLVCKEDVEIEAVPQLDRLFISGKESDVNKLIDYLNQYTSQIQKSVESDEMRMIEITLPENYKIIEELMNQSLLITSATTESSEATETTEATENKVAGETIQESLSLADSILQIMKEFSDDPRIKVVKTFEFAGRLTFIIPSRLSSLLTDIVEDLKKKAQLIGYETIKDVGVLNENIIEEVERLTGIIIDPLGSRMGYILKGRKDKIEVARYLISEFSGSASKMDSRFIELRNAEAFENIKTFLINYFNSKELGSDSFTIEKITDELVFISAPSDLLENALERLNRYEDFFFEERIQQTQQIEETIFNSGVKQILDSFFSDEILYSYVSSAELLIIFGEANTLSEVNNLLDTVIARIEEKQRMQEESISANRTSRLVPFIPSWDNEKFSSYMLDFLGDEAYNTIKIVKSGTGYLVVGNEKTIDLVEKEAERIREMQNPYYAVVRQIPPISELTRLYNSLGINIEILPVESKFIFLGPREQVLKAQGIVEEVNTGISVSEDGDYEKEKIIYDFLSIDEQDIGSMEQIFEKLSIDVELINSPGGVLAIGTKEEIEKSKNLVKSVRERKPITEDVPEDIVYRILPLEEDIGIENLQELSGQMAYDSYVVKLANNIVVVGNKEEVENFVAFYENIIEKERGELKVADRKLPFEQLVNIVDTLGLNIQLLETGEKYLFYGDDYAISMLESIINAVTAEGTDGTRSIKTKEVRLLESDIEKETLSVIADDLGLSLSFHSYDDQTVVIGDSQTLDYFMNVVEQLQTEKGEKLEYRLIRNKNLPSVDELNEIFVGIQAGISIKTVGDYLALIGSETDISKALELLDKVSYRAEEVIDGDDIERSYSLLKIPEGFDVEDLKIIAERIGIKADIIPTGVAALVIGQKDSVASLNNVLSTMYDFGEKTEGVRYGYEIITIPTNLTLNEIKELFDTIGLELNLLEITGKIVLVGNKQDIDDGMEIIKEFTPEVTGDATEVTIERKKEILLFDTTIGLTELKELIDRIKMDISISTVGTQFVAVGYPEDLSSFEDLLEKLQKVEPEEETETKQAGYIIVEKPEALSQQTIEELFNKINLDLRIQEFDTTLVLVGSSEHLVKARVFLKDLREQEKSQEEEVIPEPEKGYIFTSIPEKTTVEEVRNVLRKLEVDVELVVAGDSLVITGITENITRANEILSNLREMLTSPETAKLIYDVIPYPSDIDISVVKDALNSLKVEGDLLKSDGKLLMIGTSTEIDKIKNLIEMLKPEVDEEGKEVEEKVEKEIMLFDTAIGLTELTQLIEQIGMEMAVSAIGMQYVAVGDKETLNNFDELLKRLKVIEPTEESTEVELEYRITEKPEMVTAEALGSLFERIKLDIGVMGFESTVVMVGTAEDLDRAEVFIEDLRKQEKVEEEQVEPEPEKGYVFTPIPEGTTIDELQSILMKVELKAELAPAGKDAIIIGTEDQIAEVQNVIATMSRLGKEPQEIVKLDYELIEETPALSISELQELMNKVGVSVDIMEISGKFVLIGTSGEIKRGKQIIESFGPGEEETDEATQVKKEILVFESMLDYESMSELVSNLELDVAISRVDNEYIAVGTADVLKQLENLNERLKTIETEDMEYKVTESITGINATILNDLFEKLTLDVTAVEFDGSYVLIGIKDDLARAKSFMDDLSEQEKMKEETIEPEPDKGYAFSVIPENTTFEELQTMLRKVDTNVELVKIGNNALLIGTAEAITQAQRMISTLNDLSDRKGESVYSYNVVTKPSQLTTSILEEIVNNLKLGVEIISIGNSYMLIGEENELQRLEHIISEFSVDDETVKDKTGEYLVIQLPENIVSEKLEGIFESLNITVSVMQMDDIAVLTGDATSLNSAQDLLDHLKRTTASTETEQINGTQMRYSIVEIPDNMTVQDMQSISDVLNLNLSFEEVGNRVIVAGAESEIAKLQEVITKLSGTTDVTPVKDMQLLQKIPGVQAETMLNYLITKGITLDGLFEIGNSYLAIGTKTMLERASESIDYLATSSRGYYEIIELPSKFPVDSLEEIISQLSLSVSLISTSSGNVVAIGNEENVNLLKEIVGSTKEIGAEIKYDVADVPEALDSERIQEIINGLGLELTNIVLENKVLLIGNAGEVETASQAIRDISSQFKSQITDMAELETSRLPSVSGWDVESIKEYLEAADVKLKEIFSYNTILIGLGTEEDLEVAEELLTFLVEEGSTTYKKLDKLDIENEKLDSIIGNLGVSVNYVELDDSWLLTGPEKDLERLIEALEGIDTDRKLFTEYLKSITLSPDELEGFISTSYPEIEFTYLENLKLVILKSEDKQKLEEAKEQITDLHEELLEKDLDKNISFEDGLISINVRNEDLQGVVMHVASKLDKSVLFSEDLELSFTMFLSKVTWEEFLDTLVSSTPVKYEQIGKVYNIYKHKVTEPTESATEEQIYKVQHNQQEIKQLLEFYGATVHLDETNGIMVVKNITKSRVQEIFEQVGETVNAPKKQVRIETRLVDKSLVDDAIRDLSAEVSFAEPKLSIDSDNIGLSFKLLDTVEFDKLLQKMLTTGGASISAELRDNNSLNNVIAQPSVVAMSGEEAKIHIGESIPLTEIIRTEDGEIIEQQVGYLESGVDLKITPMINADGTIVLDLDIKVSEPREYQTSKGNFFWGENARQATTKLTIKDGNTLTIGGLVEETEKNIETKMPFLGDLPFVGKFFTSTTKSSDKRELVIFITAKVVEP